MRLGIVATDRILKYQRILAEEPIMTVRDDDKEARVFIKDMLLHSETVVIYQLRLRLGCAAR